MSVKLWIISLLAALTAFEPAGTVGMTQIIQSDSSVLMQTVEENMQQQFDLEERMLEEKINSVSSSSAQPQSKIVPILLYHHLAPEGEESGTMVYPATFARHMQLLSEHGFTPVSFEDLIAFVDEGAKLPDHPVIITFDDGYYSNYEYAFPILQEYSFPATIFAVGSSIGHMDNYKDTNHPITPHFGAEQAKEMAASGLISIHSHTYDMHQWPPFETGETVRENILPLAGEDRWNYALALMDDVAEQDTVFAACGLEKSNVLAFPGGRHATISDMVLQACGYRVTVTTDPTRVNTVVQGQSHSLIDLGRMNISGTTTDAELLRYLSMGVS